MQNRLLNMLLLLLLLVVSTCQADVDGGIECPYCNKRECLSDMNHLSCGESGYARDVCGCCFRCAATENEMCGGFRNLFGECGFDMYCKPQPIPYQSDQPIPRYGYCEKLPGAKYFQLDLIESKKEMMEILAEEMQEQELLLTKEYLKEPPELAIDIYNEFQMDDSNTAESSMFEPYTESAGDKFTLENQLWNQCEPPCTAEFCAHNPRGICSAKNILRPCEHCDENPCQHTSCLACNYEPDTSVCGYCEDLTDLKCMNKYGKCVKTMKRETRKDPSSYIKKNAVSFECAVPNCKENTKSYVMTAKM